MSKNFNKISDKLNRLWYNIWQALPFQWDMLNSVQIYRLLRVCAQLILSILLVKSGITTDDIGRFEMLLYLAMVLSFFWVNPLLNALLPSYAVHDDREERLALSKRLFFVLTFGSIILALILFYGQSIFIPLLTGRNELPYLGLISIYFIFEFPAYLGEYYYIIRERSKPLQYLGWLSYGLFILISAAILFSGGEIKELLYCMIGISVFRYIWVLVEMLGIKGLRFKSGYLNAFLKNTGALALYSVLGTIALLFDQWLVGQRFDDESTFAIFRYGARQLPFVTTLLAGFATVFTFQLAQKGMDALDEMKARALKYYHFIFPLIIFLIPLAHYLYRVFYSETFDLSASIFNIYLLVLCSRMMFTGIIFLARKMTMVMVLISIVELGINIGLSLYLVQSWGLLGIAAATVIAYYFERVAHMGYLYFKMGLRPKDYFPVKAYVLYSAIAWGIFFIVEIIL